MNFPIFCSFWALLLQADVASLLTMYATDRGLKKQPTHALTGGSSVSPLFYAFPLGSFLCANSCLSVGDS